MSATVAAAAVATTLSFGSSHREAPNIQYDPAGDNTDVYAFTAKDRPGDLTIVANWIPFEDPAGGPNFYNLDPRARYYINIDNTGDGRADVRYLFRFRTQIRNRRTFLYALPGVTSLADPKLNYVQRYSVTREHLRRGRVVRRRSLGRSFFVAPNNVGPKTFPDYHRVANEAIASLRGDAGRVFVGQREDPFFVDLGATFDGINLRRGTGNEGGGKDDLAGYNTHSFVMQVPETEVTRNGRSVAGAEAGNAVVGVWASTERRRLEVSNPRGLQRRGLAQGRGRFVQVSRLGNPLINEVVIPLGRKDEFNRSRPHQDAQFAQSVLRPELAAVLNQLFDLGIKETERTDIVTALLTGIPGVTQIGRNPTPADTLKINLGVPPSEHENRFGVIAGDNAGFPNGRRLGDDVVDIELRVIGGFLVPEDQGGKKLPLGDGVDQNDRAFLPTFPYVAPPNSGFESELKRTEPPHAPTPAQP